MGKCTDVISIGVARKSEGTIVLKEIIVIFMSNQQVRSADHLGMQSVTACNDTCIRGD